MGYFDIKNREDIDNIIEKTLSDYYGTTVRVVNKYVSNSFILNPRLNSAIYSKASRIVKKAVRKGQTSRQNLIYWVLKQIYLRLAFSKSGLFGCKYIHFENLPENFEYLYIMPGNMKIKLFDYKKKTVTNIVKQGFSTFSFEKELAVRTNPKWDFILPIEASKDGIYYEKLLEGCTFDRLKKSNSRIAYDKIKDILQKMQQNGRTSENYSDYQQELLLQIKNNLTLIKCDEAIKANIADFAQKVAKNYESDVILAASHGDFQKGNIFFDKNLRIYVLDWETFDKRSIGYDILTFFYSLRYRRDFLMRIDYFLNDSQWGDISKIYFGTVVDKKQVLSIYFLEDLLWLLQECINTSEKRISPSLLKYADSTFLQEITGRLS